ncbi:MAG: dienelactone hydrolase family protein [Pseudorhodoplanes sp.]
MGRHLSLTASDNHRLGAYRADPAGAPKGGIVVAQEIFGVNHHIRNVCDRLAAEGYCAVAPALFDRFVRDFESGYSPDDVANARKYLTQIDWDAMLRDMAAAVTELKDAGPIGVIGFCMGGSIAYLCATRLNDLKASVCFYGGQIAKFADEKPKCPVQMHFGEKDAGIPLTDVEAIRKKRPEADVHVYPGAQHGFHCDERASYDAPSSALAWTRTLAFLQTHMKQ